MSLKQIGTEITAKPLTQLQELNEQKKTDLESSLLKEALAISNDKCNSLIDKQNTLIRDLTITVKSLESGNDWNVNKLRESVSNAIVAMKNLQDETKRFNDRISTELSQTVKRTETSLQSDLRKTIQTQSEEVFSEVRKELDENKKLLESTREELKLQRGFRRFLFWATPILLLVQTIVIIVCAF